MTLEGGARAGVLWVVRNIGLLNTGQFSVSCICTEHKTIGSFQVNSPTSCPHRVFSPDDLRDNFKFTEFSETRTSNAVRFT